MFQIIKDHPYWLTFAFGVGTVLASEIFLLGIKYVRKRKLQIHEVIMFNDQSEACATEHMFRDELHQEINCSNKFCSVRNLARIIQQIDKAAYSIDIAIYTFTNIALMTAIERALKRGVIVRIITDREMAFSSGSKIACLAPYGVPVRGPDSTFMMHHKFCIIDGEARIKEIMKMNGRKYLALPYCSILINGSVNWTRQGFGGNWENCTITSDKLLTEKYQEEFLNLWKSFDKSGKFPTVA
ncbi:mitochondrial cardiolipin hydrolase [Scaptodrosophila lebanonensis]|uniref:Mitochondrial cardiolipin hydrolase n=1 Tax=Drosophila lebanonensis TaxID=7225 RepID=A0A6J2U6T6_DROLE|nr:mitochondrial cardiolipin hydrolase [Scaptodrosophila lebanonensis]